MTAPDDFEAPESTEPEPAGAVEPAGLLVRRDALGRIVSGGGSLNPGGISKEKRAFLDRLKIDDANEVYERFMGLVRQGNTAAILRAVEYIAGKPKDSLEISAAPPDEEEGPDYSKLSLEELEALKRMLVKARRDGQGAP